MTFLASEQGRRLLLVYQFISMIYLYVALSCGTISFLYQIYDNYKSTKRIKQLFLVCITVSLVMISARAMIATITRPTQAILVFYAYSVFFEIWIRYSAITEVLKLFVSLSPLLSEFRVNVLHGIVSIGHFATFSGIFWYFITFNSPAESTPMAIWFRFGSFINNLVFSTYIGGIFIWEAVLIHKHVKESKSTVSNFSRKKKKVMLLLLFFIILACGNFINFVVGLIFNEEAPSLGFVFYQYLMHITLSNCHMNAVLLPILFESIIALKFEKREKPVTVSKKKRKIASPSSPETLKVVQTTD